MLGNSIFSNDLLGIIRNSTANRRQTFPTINTATIITAGTQLQVNFQLTSVPNRTFRVELFASPVADPLGFGEGRNFLGFIDVTTGANGTVSSTATVNWSAGLGQLHHRHGDETRHERLVLVLRSRARHRVSRP